MIELIQDAIPQQLQRHQVLWELQERPALLTGQGAHGSPRVNALIHALIAAGAHGVVAPACSTSHANINGYPCRSTRYAVPYLLTGRLLAR